MLLPQHVTNVILAVEIEDGGLANNVVRAGALAGYVALVLLEVDGLPL